MIEDMLLEGCPFEDKLLDLKNLEIGKVYPSFDDGKFKPSRLCFIKIKEITGTGYIVDVEWDKEIVARDQEMIYRKNFLTTVDNYGGTITSNIYNIVKSFWLNGFIENEELGPSILKNS